MLCEINGSSAKKVCLRVGPGTILCWHLPHNMGFQGVNTQKQGVIDCDSLEQQTWHKVHTVPWNRWAQSAADGRNRVFVRPASSTIGLQLGMKKD